MWIDKSIWCNEQSPFILTLDCDMYTNYTQALREAMCFFMDHKTGHQFAFVQFPQRFHGITKNDLYANDLSKFYEHNPRRREYPLTEQLSTPL